MKIYFTVFKLQHGEFVNAYSLIPKDLIKSIDQSTILKKKLVDDKLYSKEELGAMRDSML